MSQLLVRSCWTAGDARDVLVTEALAGDDSLFLATHSPVHGFEVGGSARDVEEPTEEGLLRALSAPERRHAFCVVQGEPGSGKSHLIRWLSVNWPEGPDLPILVQRANGSLEGTLRQLQTRLHEFEHLFQSLRNRQAAGLSGRASQFLLTLGGSLAPDFFEKPLDDTDWCRENDPSSLLLNTEVRKGWSGPMRILKLMDGADGERNSATASFNLEDIQDLARYCGSVHDSVASERLARRLMKEVAFLGEAIADGRTVEEIKSHSAGEIRASMALIDALNARRNYAVQQVIGISADGLKKLFEELRVELAKRHRRIVLLLEDITSWEGLDDSLVDVLVTDAQTRPEADLCPLISVVGVTPEYFAKLPPNYRQRITHDIRLGQQQGQLQDVAALRESEDRAAFVARYLNAARAGAEQLQAWRERFRTERRLSPPNPCQTCTRAESCHTIFGDVDGIGLFPFTRDAVDNFFFALKEDDGGQTHRTPRGLLQAVLGPTLLQPKVMDGGEYPGPQLETSALERLTLPGALQGRLNAQVTELRTRERLRRLLAYWGDRRPELRRTPEGESAYAGVTRGLVAAFGLPWIAEDVANAPPRPATTPAVPAQGTAPLSSTRTPDEPIRREAAGDVAPRPQVRQIAERQSGTPVVRSAAPNRSQLERMRNDIEALREGLPLQRISEWNRALFDVLQLVDFRKLGVDRWTWGKIFTAETVKIAGTGAVRAQHFVIDRSDWLADGLEAYAALRIGDVSEEEADYLRRRLAFMARRLEALAAAHLDRRLPKLETGELWSPAATVAQILLARAWLRGTTGADRPTYEQWTDVLSEENPRPESEPNSRTEPWQAALNATGMRHDLLRRALHDMARLPQGASAGFGISDASTVAAAMVAIVQDCKLSPLPKNDGEALPDDIKTILEVARRLGSLATIPLQERKLLTSRGATLMGLLRGQGISAHLRRLDKVISEVAAQLPTTHAHLVRDWKMAFVNRRRFMEDTEVAGRIQSTIFDLIEDGNSLPGRSSSLLGWLAQAPSGDLKGALELAQLGERVVEEFLPHVRDLARDAGLGTDFAEVHEQGCILRTAAAKALADLTEAAE